MADAASKRLRFISATTSWFIGDGRPVPDVPQPLTRPNSWRPSSGNGRRKGRLAQRSRPAVHFHPCANETTRTALARFRGVLVLAELVPAFTGFVGIANYSLQR